jgi:hypothetical protein
MSCVPLSVPRTLSHSGYSSNLPIRMKLSLCWTVWMHLNFNHFWVGKSVIRASGLHAAIASRSDGHHR